MLKTLSKTVFSLVFPVSCELCDASLPDGAPGVCRRCRSFFRPIPAPHCAGCGRHVPAKGEHCGRCRAEQFHFDRAFACVPYDERMKALLHAYKFKRRRFLTPFFEELLAEFLFDHLSPPEWDIVVPVPMHVSHERERGFNQAKLLSAFLSEASGKPHAPGALGVRAGATQSSLTKRERAKNAAGRFFVRDAAAVAGRNILLVDDILTTGHTVSACAKALKDAGAGRVTAFAAARGVD